MGECGADRRGKGSQCWDITSVVCLSYPHSFIQCVLQDLGISCHIFQCNNFLKSLFQIGFAYVGDHHTMKVNLQLFSYVQYIFQPIISPHSPPLPTPAYTHKIHLIFDTPAAFLHLEVCNIWVTNFTFRPGRTGK